MNMICYAPAALSEWYSTQNIDALERFELQLPRSNNERNKAGFRVKFGRYLGSFTVWGQGTTEWIVVDGVTGETIISEDSQFVDVAQLYLLLDRALEQLKDLAK